MKDKETVFHALTFERFSDAWILSNWDEIQCCRTLLCQSVFGRILFIDLAIRVCHQFRQICTYQIFENPLTMGLNMINMLYLLVSKFISVVQLIVFRKIFIFPENTQSFSESQKSKKGYLVTTKLVEPTYHFECQLFSMHNAPKCTFLLAKLDALSNKRVRKTIIQLNDLYTNVDVHVQSYAHIRSN